MQRQVETSVRSKILYLIQAWAHAFRNEPKYKVVQDTYQIMKVEGEDSVGKGGWTIGQAALLWRSFAGEGRAVRTLSGVSKVWTCNTELFLGVLIPNEPLEVTESHCKERTTPLSLDQPSWQLRVGSEALLQETGLKSGCPLKRALQFHPPRLSLVLPGRVHTPALFPQATYSRSSRRVMPCSRQNG